MAWTSTIVLDEDKQSVGHATAVWNAGQADEFTYSRRVVVNATDGQTFAAEAKAARTAKIARTTREATLKATLDGYLNS